MNNYRKHLRAALISALGYGLGFVIGVALIRLVLNIGFLKSISDNIEHQRLYFGLVILFVVVILGGALAGALGGLSLAYAVGSENRRRTIARSALGIGTGFGIVLLPILLLIAMQAMYNTGGSSPLGFSISIGLVGALFGFVSGLMTGTLPAKTSYWRVAGIAALAFGLGGLAFGFGLWQYFYRLYQSGAAPFELLFSFLLFGGVGGFFLGWLFSQDQEILAQEGSQLRANALYRATQWFKHTKFYRKRGFWGTLIFVFVIFLLTRLLAMSPLSASSGHISDFLPSQSIGVHWSGPWAVSESTVPVADPSIAQSGDLLAVAWAQDGAIYLATSASDDTGIQIWQHPQKMLDSAGMEARNPKVAVDAKGGIHLLWTETAAGQEGASVILYRYCLQGDCSTTTVLSDLVSDPCASETNLNPAIAVNSTEVLAVWGSSSSNLPYATWKIGDSPAMAATGCALAAEVPAAANPRLAARPEGGFALAFDDGAEIFVAVAQTAGQAFEVGYQEAGKLPEVLVDARGTIQAAWCGTDGQVRYREEGTLTKIIPAPPCLSRPVLGQDTDGILHLLWHADQAKQPSGQVLQSNLIYESRLIASVWSDPLIVGLSAAQAQPALANGSDGRLHLVWADAFEQTNKINYASYRVYRCDAETLNTQGKLALEVATSGVYRPADDIVPYCQNQFDRLLILPKADPAYSDVPPTLNGAFDQVADLVRGAQYEVLLSTMWYETDDTNTSPGFVLAQGVKGLYDQVKAHPERYPRGVTVRILLDNPPEFTLSRLITQVWSVFQHMRAAGLPMMSDPEIGWKLEVANYAGSWPHGHTKMIVIDGKTAIAAGFNYQHKHQSKDHPSGKGADDYDLGLQMTGPVAQTTQLAFDDLWSGSNRITCPDLGSDSPFWWLSCKRTLATAEHVLEADQFYLADENHNAFALHRTMKFNESDVTIAKAVTSAQETLDVLQVNFTLKMICDLNVLFRVCNFGDALTYMDAMMAAIEANQVKTRVLIKPGVIEGVESNVAVQEFHRALVARGLEDLVEFRYFNDSVHAKAVLIDDEFLIVGSQNFHYSAWGVGAGLTEFNIGTDDPDAITAFKRFFDYHWERGTPVPLE